MAASLPPFTYLAPASLGEALDALQAPGAVPFAGGTDLLVRLKRERREAAASPSTLVDIKCLTEAQGIVASDGGLRIGALVTAAQLAEDALVATQAAALAEAARATAAPALRRRATVGGNLCTPHPAGDVATALLALDAEVEVATPAGREYMPVESWLDRSTMVAPARLVLAVWIPPLSGSAFVKFGPREAFCRALVAVAVARTTQEVRVALGGVASRPVRARHAEKALAYGATLAEALARDCSPPSDEQASSHYRLLLAETLTRRCLASLDAAMRNR